MLDMHQRTVSTIVGRSAVDTPTGLFLAGLAALSATRLTIIIAVIITSHHPNY